MQTPNNKKGLFFVQVNLVAGTRVGEWCAEPFIERLHRVENFGKDEVQEGP